MNMIAKLKPLPLIAALLTGLTLAPTTSMAGPDNERNQHAQKDRHSAHQQHARSRGKHKDKDKHAAQKHGHHPVMHLSANRYHQGHGHHRTRVVYLGQHHRHNHRHGYRHGYRHGHRHTLVRNSYRQPVYVSDYPRITLGLHGDNFDIIYRDR